MSPAAKKATPRKTTDKRSGAARKAAAPGATKAAAKAAKVTKAAKGGKRGNAIRNGDGESDQIVKRNSDHMFPQ